MTKALQIIQAIEQNPSLLFDVLSTLIAKNPLIAGPWLREGTDYPRWSRKNVHNTRVAFIIYEGNSAAFGWLATLAEGIKGENPDPLNTSRATRKFRTEDEAQTWCDEALTKHGYTLIK